MSKRKIEVFSAGCFLCRDAIEQIKNEACQSCEIVVYELNDLESNSEVARKVKEYGISSVPAVVINGELADCCKNKKIDLSILRSLGLGVE